METLHAAYVLAQKNDVAGCMVLQLPGCRCRGIRSTILLTHRAISAVQFEHVVSVKRRPTWTPALIELNGWSRNRIVEIPTEMIGTQS
jgi:hypothetical protein